MNHAVATRIGRPNVSVALFRRRVVDFVDVMVALDNHVRSVDVQRAACFRRCKAELPLALDITLDLFFKHGVEVPVVRGDAARGDYQSSNLGRIAVVNDVTQLVLVDEPASNGARHLVVLLLDDKPVRRAECDTVRVVVHVNQKELRRRRDHVLERLSLLPDVADQKAMVQARHGAVHRLDGKVNALKRRNEAVQIPRAIHVYELFLLA